MPSNAVAEIRYDNARERLAVAASFQSAFSKGTFFNTYIRDRYDFREITRARAS